MTQNSNTNNLLLIVEDDQATRQNLRDFMELKGFKVLDADNGIAALRVLEDHTPDAIILDLVMPEMGGIELLENFIRRKVDIPVVIMTAFGTIDRAVKAMKLGAAEFITKPIDYEHMLRVVQRVLDTARLRHRVKQQQEQMDADLRLAGKIQKATLPDAVDTPRLSLNYRFEPMLEIGGDNLVVHVYDPGHVAVALYDATGHGVAAALVASMVHIELLTRLKEERPPFNVVEHLHRFIERTIGKTEMYLTLIVADIDLDNRTLTATNVAHPELLLWKQESKSLESIPAHLPPVGVGIKKKGTATESELPLSKGDRAILYTDGFPETRCRDGGILGGDRFRQLLEQNVRLRAVDFLEEIFRTVDGLRAGEPEDDRTLVLVDVK